MNPDDVERMISLGLDGELSPEETNQLEAVLNEHPEYRDLQAQLTDLKARCQSPTPLPSARLYEKTLDRITSTYPSSHQSFGSRWQVWAGLAAVALLAFLAGYLVRPPAPTNGMVNLTQMEQNLYHAKTEYQAAIAQLERLAEKRIAQMPPEVAQQVAENLKIVNHAIQACEDLTQAYPDHYTAYASLAKAYQAKVDLLETLVDGSHRRS